MLQGIQAAGWARRWSFWRAATGATCRSWPTSGAAPAASSCTGAAVHHSKTQAMPNAIQHLLRELVWKVRPAVNMLTSITTTPRRAIRNQQFIRFTRADLTERVAKLRGAADAYWEAHPKHRLPQVGPSLMSVHELTVGVLMCTSTGTQLTQKCRTPSTLVVCCHQQAWASPTSCLQSVGDVTSPL